ncbi:17705_t:CDS:2 [Funneliformis geosporum]|nr:17705_t:CDS:2 [Funneliformis geosporum]
MSFENAFKDSSDSQLKFDTDKKVDETSNNLQNLLNDETSTLILDTNNSQDSQSSQNSHKTIERYLKRHNIIVPKVILNQQPFQVVGNKNFIKMINTFDHNIQSLIDIKLKSWLFKNSTNTSTLSSKAYLGLTIHYIDQNLVLQRFLLDIIPFKICHSEINIASSISNVFGEFNLISKAIALTTDNESAMLVYEQKLVEEYEGALDNLSFNHYRCSTHILNIGAKHRIKVIDKEILNMHKLIAKIKNSVLLYDSLRKLYTIEKIKYLRPEIDIETRWNSTYYML